MKRTVMLIMIDNRTETAVDVQKILTGWGRSIKTRLGIHDGALDTSEPGGLIMLELVGETEKHDELLRKLSLLKGVNAKLVRLQLESETK